MSFSATKLLVHKNCFNFIPQEVNKGGSRSNCSEVSQICEITGMSSKHSTELRMIAAAISSRNDAYFLAYVFSFFKTTEPSALVRISPHKNCLRKKQH